MNLEPLNSRNKAKYRHGSKVTVFAADSMQSRILRHGYFWNPGTHVVSLYRNLEKVGQLCLSPGERVDLVNRYGDIIDAAIEPLESQDEVRLANSRTEEKAKRLATGFGYGKPAFVEAKVNTGEDVAAGSPQPESKYIYFCNRGEASNHAEIREAFRKFGASVEIVNMEGRPSWTLKL
jgi:hypothetical protein